MIESQDILEWKASTVEQESYKIDISVIKKYIIFKDHKGNLNLINKFSGFWFQFSPRIEGEYYFYKDGRLMNKTDNFKEIELIINQILEVIT